MTRIIARTLLKGGDPLIDFTARNFDGVTREQAVAFLDWALDAACQRARGEEEHG